MTASCPVIHCGKRLKGSLVMCHPHWFMVPRPLRAAVRDAYDAHGAGSPEHAEATTAAVAAVNERIENMLKVMRP